MREYLQSFPDDVIGGRLNFLDARDVITANNDGEVGEAATVNLSTVIAEKGDCQHAALACFLQSHHYVARSSTGGDSDCDIVRLRLSNQLSQKDDLSADIVCERCDVGRLHGKRDRGNWMIAGGRQYTVQRPVVGVGG